ncbi:hypothetical protein GCM10009798_23350 [Nocardioides panacihumi]|uniref:Uncharacterized protein n=1 Tax=Nocardioides panacihumi TaxID=400774 RepID=A0ABN2R3A1_9ACTN
MIRVEGLHRECQARIDLYNLLTPEQRREHPNAVPEPPCGACHAKWTAALAADQGDFLLIVESAHGVITGPL